MNYKIQISKKSDTVNKIFLINKESQLKDYISNAKSLAKIKKLLNKDSKLAYTFDGESVSFFVKLSKDLEVNRISASSCFGTLSNLKINDV